MKKNEEVIISAKDYDLNEKLTKTLTMPNLNTTTDKFQYECSFCLRELPSGGIRFNGFGACPRCYRLAHQFVDALRGHRANYANNLGVRK